MRVGVTAHFQFSVFSGGGSQSTLAVAETMKMMGHTVTLININGTQEWWDDLISMKNLYPRINVADIKEPFDLVLEVGHTVADKETRLRIANHSVWIVRKPILIADIEHSIFPVSLGKRNLEGLSAVWCFDQEIFDDELQYLETLTRVPVRKVPFVWTPSIVEIYRKETGMPTWIQLTVSAIQQAQKVLPWSVHICETNNSATSSATIPLVALREAKRQGQFFFTRYKIHNAQPIEHSQFFKQNVWNHCQIEGLSGEFLGRQRIVDFTVDPMSCVFSHLRFRRIRPYLLDAIWCGIPIVHNSPVLRDLESRYANYYYDDNSITGACRALLHIQEDLASAQGMFQQGAFSGIQQKILERFSPISTYIHTGWKGAIESLPSIRPLISFPTTTAAVPEPIVAAALPLSTYSSISSVSEKESTVHILFTDMWDDFNPDYNMFVLMMREGSKQLSPRPVIHGYSLSTLPQDVQPNLLFFGPFGTEYRNERWNAIPKAHFTGENTKPILGPQVFLNMGFCHAEFVDEKYVRLPLWMLEIDWFGADLEKIRNPKPLPIDRCTKVYPEEISKKQRFCAFVVTNPCNPVRNSAFHWLSQYKQVDSAGRLFNNIGEEIFAGLGGGGGELKKHEFLKQYKFCLAYENSSSQGYTTEKLLHAKIAGCIPIYWGDPKVERDFDTKGFIDARNFTTPEELVEAVRKIDTDPEAYAKMFSRPALDEYKRDLVRRTLSQIAFSLLRAAMPSRDLKHEQIPRFLGASSTEEAQRLRLEREGVSIKEVAPVAPVVPVTPPTIRLIESPQTTTTAISNNPLIASMASLRFLPSLHQMLSGLSAQKRVLEGLEARIWLASDVPEAAEKTLVESFPFAKFLRMPETDIPEGFSDYWNPAHFAWKIWIYHQLSQDTALHGRLLLYMDSGIFMCRWPRQWLQIVMEEGICALHDPRETNGRWCHETFCRIVQVTEEEKASNQIIAGCMAFVGGNEKARRLFAEAYSLSKNRDVIVGAKWEGVRDGKPFGHRHDQSILSILTQRYGVARYPLDTIYCDHSLRKTFLTGKALYVHRGAFTVHKAFSKEIDDAFVINLERRPDRLEKMFTSNPELKDRVQRLAAYDGKQIKLTPAIARLFKPHDFFWKKAIMGCALSHLHLWWQLVHERPEIHNYLIMEDDCKLQVGWEEKWNAAAGYIPEDYDIVYLGGILPPNRQGFERVKERVNDFFSRVAPNQIFGQRQPNRYFHWCNYAYILSRKGAEKILQILFENGGYWTSADHMVCNRVDTLNHYFLDPLVAGCYQDEDPKYQASAFNDFNRVDSFDSDLWNNDERFSASEVETMLKESESANIDIEKALADGRVTAGATAPSLSLSPSLSPSPENSEKKEEHVIGKSKDSNEAITAVIGEVYKEAYTTVKGWTSDSWKDTQTVQRLLANMPYLRRSSMPAMDPPLSDVRHVLAHWRSVAKPTEQYMGLWKEVEAKLEIWSSCAENMGQPPSQQTRSFVTLAQHNFKGTTAYEREWMEELLGSQFPFRIQTIEAEDPPPCENPIVIVQRPYIDAYTALFLRWEAQKIPFYIFHVSDEYMNDDLTFYTLEMCKGIVRMYTRPDIPGIAKVKTKTIPLGYHWTTANSSDDPLNKTPRLPFRNNVWSFYGTGWQQRAELLAPLTQIQPHLLKLMDSWESPEKLTQNQYIAILLDTIFVPCPGGNNIETFRLYEALECGCIPLYVKTQGDDAYVEMLQNEIGILPVSSWQEATVLVLHFMKEKEIMENYRNSLLTRWRLWKQRLGEDMKRIWAI